jgi:peroxidase
LLGAGAHTIGKTQCQFFTDRIYKFDGVFGATDPDIDPAFLKKLKQSCPIDGSKQTTTRALDQATFKTFDNQYFNEVQAKHGVLFLDQALAANNVTTGAMEQFAGNKLCSSTNLQPL